MTKIDEEKPIEGRLGLGRNEETNHARCAHPASTVVDRIRRPKEQGVPMISRVLLGTFVLVLAPLVSADTFTPFGGDNSAYQLWFGDTLSSCSQSGSGSVCSTVTSISCIRQPGCSGTAARAVDLLIEIWHGFKKNRHRWEDVPRQSGEGECSPRQRAPGPVTNFRIIGPRSGSLTLRKQAR
jgi:hypothetical protein